MRKRKLLSKEKIQQIVRQHKQTIPEIEVECGKGQKPRTVGVSEWFASQLTGYVNRYLDSASPESWLFRSERGWPIKYPSIYSKVKRIGIKSGIWLYRKDGRLKPRFSPHKMRHTFGTGLLNASGNTWLVQIELGHTKAETSQIYARTLSEKISSDMNNFHNCLWSKCEQQNENQSLIDDVHCILCAPNKFFQNSSLD